MVELIILRQALGNNDGCLQAVTINIKNYHQHVKTYTFRLAYSTFRITLCGENNL